jgi:hypothetical protein
MEMAAERNKDKRTHAKAQRRKGRRKKRQENYGQEDCDVRPAGTKVKGHGNSSRRRKEFNSPLSLLSSRLCAFA